MCALAASACTLPRDSDGSLDRIRGGTMRVGFVVDTPWVTDSAEQAGGIEGRLVREIADSLHAGITWISRTESRLLEMLHRRELDLVIGGLTEESPWKQKVGFTLSYYTDTVLVGGKPHAAHKHVLAVPPGENAWMMAIERTLLRNREIIPRLARQARP